MPKVRIVVEVLDDEGDLLSGCQRDGCRLCGWARQSKVLDISSDQMEVARIETLMSAHAFEMTERMVVLNEQRRKEGWGDEW